jgi:hypothetical protein
VGTSTYSGTAESGQQVVAPERVPFTVERYAMDWCLTLGGGRLHTNQYGKLTASSWNVPYEEHLRARLTRAAEVLRVEAFRFEGRNRRLSEQRRAELQRYADLLNEGGL